MGLANRLTPNRARRSRSRVELAHQIAAFPQRCLRSDRRSSFEQWDLPLAEALANETTLGLEVDPQSARRSRARRGSPQGAGRHGQF